jgi:hypothetical protein
MTRNRPGVWLALAAAVTAGCQTPPATRPRILSVQTPRGLYAPPAKTSRDRPYLVPTAPVGSGTGPGAVAVPMIPAAPAALPPGAGLVPAAPSAMMPPPGAPAATYVSPPCPTCNKDAAPVPPPFGGG